MTTLAKARALAAKALGAHIPDVVRLCAAIDALAARVEALEGAGGALRRWVRQSGDEDLEADDAARAWEAAAARVWDELMAGAEQAWAETTPKPGASCPDRRDDCIGWVTDGRRCGRTDQ